MIKINHLKKVYHSVTPLEDINTEINKGDIVAVIGPSGTGKSTLLRMINCLEDATSGEIIFDGENILSPDYDKSDLRKRIGMVFQNFNLFTHMNVAENVMYGLKVLKGMSPQDAYEKALLRLKQVGLADKQLAYPDELSGGQQQRVAIARTLAMEPEMILLDEPTSALDPTMVGEVKSVIRGLAKDGMTMMIVTHDMDFAKEIATRILYMDQGVIYEEGSPDKVFNHPEKERTRQFMEKLKVLRKELQGKYFDYPSLVSELEEYGKRIILTPQQNYRMQVLIEEIIMQHIMPTADDDIKIELMIEHSDESGKNFIRIRYNGEKRNCLAGGDEVSAKLIEGAASAIEYKEISEEVFTNELLMQLNA